MQQTPKYKLNLIEASDVFSPNPLNENTEKTEAALEAVRAEAAAGDTALEERIIALEVHKLAAGAYIGNGKNTGDSQIIEVGFTPVLVLLNSTTGTHIVSKDFTYTVVEIVPGGFKVFKQPNPYSNTDANANGAKYSFFAIC